MDLSLPFNGYGFLEAIPEIRCYIFLTRTLFLYTRDCSNKFPTNVLEFCFTYNSSVTVDYTEDISDIKCQFLIKCLEESLMQDRNDKIVDIYASIYFL